MKNKVTYFLFEIWVWLGSKIVGWPYIDVYCPNKENVTAITFSKSKKYIDKLSKIK